MKNPLIPMIAITGKPTKDEIDNIIADHNLKGGYVSEMKR